MDTDRAAAVDDHDDTQTDVYTSDDKLFCIEMGPDDSNHSTGIHYDAPASERDAAYQRLDGLSDKFAALSDGDTKSDPSALGVITNRKWANGRTLTVCFFGGSTTLQEKVQNCASQWTQFANIKFDFVKEASADIRIAFTGRGGRSDSYIGTDNLTIKKSRSTMNLGLDDSSPLKEIRRTTLHEFGHALGCIHEHSQPNVDIEWNRQAVIDAHKGFWDQSTVEHNIFYKYNRRDVKSSAFDQFSIMLYPIPESWTYGGFSSKLNYSLSDTDKAFISAMYPFQIPTPPFPVPPPVPPTYLPPHASYGDIAAIKWADSPNEEIRIYYQRSDSYVYEGAWSGNRWNSGDTKLVKAKFGTPITALVFDTWNPIQLRLYYLDNQNRIREHCWMGQGWTEGAMLPSSSIATDTRLASCGWSDGSGAHIKVYYQKSNIMLSTISYSYHKGWTVEENGDITWGYQPSSMSANRLGEDIHLYKQGNDTASRSLNSVRVRPDPPRLSYDLMKQYRVPDGTGISAVSWLSHQRVYFVDDHGSVCEMCNDGVEWITPPGQLTSAKANPRARLAAVLRSPIPARISVYFVESGQNQLTEMAYDGSRWGLSKLPF